MLNHTNALDSMQLASHYRLTLATSYGPQVETCVASQNSFNFIHTESRRSFENICATKWLIISV